MPEEKSSVKGLGTKLHQEREARDITLEEISRSTKISVHLLHAIEQDDWNALPGGIFTRNFLRLYANYLGLDAERYVDEYQQFIKIKNVAEGKPLAEETHQTEHDEPNAMSPGMLVVLIAVPIILLIGGYLAISYLPSQQDGPDASNTNPANLPEETTNPGNVESATVLTGEAAIVEEEPISGLQIELVETRAQTCWFQAWADDAMITPEGGDNLLIDQVRTFAANGKFRLFMAHISGIELRVNGETKSLEEYLVRRTENNSAVIEITIENDDN